MATFSADAEFAEYEKSYADALEEGLIAEIKGNPSLSPDDADRLRRPGIIHIDGTLSINGVHLSAESVRKAGQFQPLTGDMLVATYPRCRATWTLAILAQIKYGGTLPENFMLGNEVGFLEFHPAFSPCVADSMLKRPPPRILKTHLPAEWFVNQMASSGLKVIHVIRDPRDCLVSRYHFAISLTNKHYKAPFKSFFKVYLAGKLDRGDWFDITNGYLYLKEQFPDRVMILRYEDMLVSLEETVLTISKFVGKELLASELELVVKNSSFAEMKNDRRISEITVLGQLQTSSLIRQGKAEEWKQYFDDEMIQQFKEFAQTKRNPAKSLYGL